MHLVLAATWRRSFFRVEIYGNQKVGGLPSRKPMTLGEGGTYFRIPETHVGFV